jgi:hypothetical protein
VRWGALVTFATILAIAIAFVKRARPRIAAMLRLWRILPSGKAATPTPLPTEPPAKAEATDEP